MDWSYPTDRMLAQDRDGIGRMLGSFAEEVGGPPLRGTRFLYEPDEMMQVTRQIEDALRPGDELLVGFQTFERFRREAIRYQAIIDRGVRVTAFAHMDGPAPGTGRSATRNVFGIDWVELGYSRRRLENQWFLVVTGTQRVAFVGYEVSGPEWAGSGGVLAGRRSFSGFLSDDGRIVDSLSGTLRGVARGSVHRHRLDEETLAAAEPARLIVCATREDDHAAERTLTAAIDLARKAEARLMLYDRTNESYLVDPYPYPEIAGPEDMLTRLDVFRLGRPYLAAQIDEGIAAGVDVVAWLPRKPGPKGMIECVDRFSPDLILLPAELDRPSLMDRLRGNTLAAFRSVVRAPIWVSNPDGSVTVSAPIKQPA